MVFPIGDDNTGRSHAVRQLRADRAQRAGVRVPAGDGHERGFTYAFSTVPEEIRTGEDVAAPVRDRGRRRAAHHPAAADAGLGLPDAAHLDVHARRPGAPARQHALPVDLRRQRRGRPRARPLPAFYLATGVLASLLTWSRPSCSAATRSSRALARPARSRACWAATWCCTRTGGARDHPADVDGRPGLRGRRPLVRLPAAQRLGVLGQGRSRAAASPSWRTSAGSSPARCWCGSLRSAARRRRAGEATDPLRGGVGVLPRRWRCRLDDSAFFHHEADALQKPKVLERIAFDADDVRQPP